MSRRSSPSFAHVKIGGYPIVVADLLVALSSFGVQLPDASVESMEFMVRRDAYGNYSVASLEVSREAGLYLVGTLPELSQPVSDESPFAWLWSEVDRLLPADVAVYLRDGYKSRDRLRSNERYRKVNGK